MWVVSGLVGAYNTLHQHFLVKQCASAQKSCITVVGCVHSGGGCSINISISVNCQQVHKNIKTKKRPTTKPPTNIYFIVKTCTSAQKSRITVFRCVRKGREGCNKIII